MSTPNLGVAHIAAAQTSKEVTANTAFDDFDGAITALESINCAGNTDVTPNATTTTFSRRLKLTGALTGNINLIVPTSAHEYVIDNQTTGAFTVTVKTSGGTGIATFGAGWGSVPGCIRILYCDGTNVINADEYSEGTWTPVATSLTNVGGAPTLTGTYTRLGRLVRFNIKIVPVTNTSSTAGTTKITLPFTPARNATCAATDDAVANLGSGLVKTDGSVYPPAWTTDTNTVYITGSFEVF